MLPAFRSNAAALRFCALLVFVLSLPLLLPWIGLPSREEAYKSISIAAGTPGSVVRSIYQDSADGDIAFLGSSLIEASLRRDVVAQALQRHLHRPVRVDVLAMNWPGTDQQYYMLRDYLEHH